MPRLEHAQRLGQVLVLALFVLALHDDARLEVREPHGRGGLVDVLAAGAARAERVEAVVVGLEIDFDVFRLGQHGDGRGRGVDAALRFGLGHALHAVAAAFVLQLAVDALRLRSPATISLKPPSSVALWSRISIFQPFASAWCLYISYRSRANSAASSPPVPARISMMHARAVGVFAADVISSSSFHSASRSLAQLRQLGLGQLAHLGVVAVDHLLRFGDLRR